MPTGVYERKLKPMQERLFSKVTKTDRCWLWTGSVGPFGHGQIGNGNFNPALNPKRLLTTHRVSYQLHYGTDPGHWCVLHRCDVPNCVRPSHLFLGSMQDNTDDMRMKGRMVVGEAHPRSKLTEADIVAIRSSTEPYSALGERFGVTSGCISQIRSRKKWKHVA